MAATPTAVRRNDVHGNQRKTITDVVMDNSYPTGGEPLTAAQLGLQLVQDAECEVVARGANGPVSANYDIANAKLKALSATGEVANLTDLSAATVRVVAYGY